MMLFVTWTLLACAPKVASTDPFRAAAEATGWVREDGVGADGPRSTWCRDPDPTVGCLAQRLVPGAGWRVLEADRWEAADVPPDGWGGWLTVSGAVWQLELVRHVAGTETDRLSLGSVMTQAIEITEVTASGGEFSGFLDQRTVGAAVCSRLDALWVAEQAALDGGQVERCHYGHYTGDASLLCRPVPLPAAEVAAWRQQLEREHDRHCEQARADAPALAALLRRLWPG